MVAHKLLLLSTVLVAILFVSGFSSSIREIPFAEAQQKEPGANWEYINYDLAGSNFNPQTKLNKDNIANIELKWVFPFPTSALSTSALPGVILLDGISGPVLMVDGIVYLVTNNQRIFAFDAKTGKTLWEYQVTADNAKALKEQSIFRLRSHAHGVNYIDGKIWINTMPCRILGLGALTGKVDVSIENLCKDVPTNAGLYKGGGYGSNPPVIDHKRNIMIWGVGGDNEGVTQGRTHAAGIDVKTGKVLWRSFVQPPNEKAFPAEKKAWGDWLVNNCNRGWIQGYSACAIPQDALRNDWGKMPTGAELGRVDNGVGISDFWGHWALDEETGIVYMGTAQPGPDANSTDRPGPNLMSNSVVAFDVMTGEIKWYHQTTTHDLVDWDCSWNTVLGKIGNQKVVYKACKNAAIYAMDAATGKALWIFDAGPQCVAPPSKATSPYPSDVKVTYGNFVTKYPSTCFFDPLDPASYTKPWRQYPAKTNTGWVNPRTTGSVESDIALAYGNIYITTFNNPSYTGGQAPFLPEVNGTIFAIDAATGAIKWRYYVKDLLHRGGTIVSGGLVYVNQLNDGNLYVLDAQTGAVILKKYFGSGLGIQPTIGFNADGKPMIMVILGGKVTAGSGGVGPGAIMAYGLPDKLPEPQVITKEVIKEVIKEVPKEVVKEVVKEVPKEVIKEVTKTVTVESIGPVTYGAIGVAVVMAVVAVVALSRRKSA
jgi:glucose dehydrogenase